MKQLLSTKDVAERLGVNGKMIYSLISDKGLPATKITGKWLFPSHLLEDWVERNTVNHEIRSESLQKATPLLVIAGSNDILLEMTIGLFMKLHPDHLAVFGNCGSMGGLRALRRGLCHIATSHLKHKDGDEFNFSFTRDELDETPATMNFCLREQGLMVPRGNPKGVETVADLAGLQAKGLRMVNRPATTGTRRLLDLHLEEADINTKARKDIPGYGMELERHMDVGLEILSGRAYAGPGIRAVASRLGLDFISLGWERFDLLISKRLFFDKGVQAFLALLHEDQFQSLATNLDGYDPNLSGKMVYPMET